MSSTNTAVLFPITPWPTERLAHYLGRVADHHGYSTIAWIIDVAGLQGTSLDTSTGLRRAVYDPESGGLLSELLGINAKLVDDMRLPILNKSGHRSIVTLGHYSVNRDLLSPIRRRYCPCCERDGQCDSKLFDVAHYLACHLHHCKIVDACRCGKHLDWMSGKIPHCKTCGFSDFLSATPADPDLVELSQHIADLYNGFSPAPDVPYRDLPTLLELLMGLSGAINPASALGRFDYGAERLSYETLSAHAVFAWRLIRSHRSFEQTSRAWIHARKEMWPQLPARAWSVDLQRCLDDIEDGSSKAALQGWLDGVNRSVTEPSAFDGNNPPAVDASVTLKWSAWILGTTAYSVKRLIKANMLSYRPAFSEREKTDVLVSLHDLNQFCHKLRSAAKSSAKSDWSPLSSSIRTFRNGYSYGLERAILDVLTSKRFGAWQNESGFEGFLLGPDKEIRKSLFSASKKAADGISIAQVSIRTGLNQTALYHLIKVGILKTSFHNVHGVRRRCLTQQQLNNFRETYVFSGELAKQWSVNTTNLTDRLIDQGLQPVSGPSIDGGIVYLFRRNDASRVDPATLKKEVQYRSRSGRKAKYNMQNQNS